jgi:hypothetical protein
MSDDRQLQDSQNVPWIQRLYDRPFVWLLAGFVTMLAFYTLWGIFEIYHLPQATLP